MDADERDIFHFLKTWGSQFVSAREICRRAGQKKRYHQEPEWAKVILLRMAERGLLEADSTGRYRLKPRHKKGPTHGTSPEASETPDEADMENEVLPDDASTGELSGYP